MYFKQWFGIVKLINALNPESNVVSRGLGSVGHVIVMWVVKAVLKLTNVKLIPDNDLVFSFTTESKPKDIFQLSILSRTKKSRILPLINFRQPIALCFFSYHFIILSFLLFCPCVLLSYNYCITIILISV
jgi:hypothetical protein